LEGVFGNDRYQPLDWYKAGLDRCRAVARVESITGRAVGSGFLVRRGDFFPDGGDELILLTTSHVICPEDNPIRNGITPSAARANFEALGATAQIYKVGELLWTSPPDKLDATFVSLKGEGGKLESCCPLKPPPERYRGDDTQRVFIIGYPLGAGLSFSLQDSIWLDFDPPRLSYRTPTDEGSSGSPVFDQDYWVLLALHRGHKRSESKNEGIPISAILEQTQKQVER
jgi:hypothetical protein